MGYKSTYGAGDGWGGWGKSSYTPDAPQLAQVQQQVEDAKPGMLKSVGLPLAQSAENHILNTIKNIPGSAMNLYKGLLPMAGLGVQTLIASGLAEGNPAEHPEAQAQIAANAEQLKKAATGLEHRFVGDPGELSYYTKGEGTHIGRMIEKDPVGVLVDATAAAQLATGGLGLAGRGLTASDALGAEAPAMGARALESGAVLAPKVMPMPGAIGRAGLALTNTAEAVAPYTTLAGIKDKAVGAIVDKGKAALDANQTALELKALDKGVEKVVYQQELKGNTNAPTIDELKDTARQYLADKKGIPVEDVVNAKPLEEASRMDRFAASVAESSALRKIGQAKVIEATRTHHDNVQDAAKVDKMQSDFEKAGGTSADYDLAHEVVTTPKSMMEPEKLAAYEKSPAAQLMVSHMKELAEDQMMRGVQAGHFTEEAAATRPFMPKAYELADRDIISGAVKDIDRDELAAQYADKLKALPAEDTADLTYYKPITEKGESKNQAAHEAYPGQMKWNDDPGFMKHYRAGDEAMFDPYEGAKQWYNQYNRSRHRTIFKQGTMIPVLQEHNMLREIPSGGLTTKEETTLSPASYEIGGEDVSGRQLAVPRSMEKILTPKPGDIPAAIKAVDWLNNKYKNVVLNIPGYGLHIAGTQPLFSALQKMSEPRAAFDALRLGNKGLREAIETKMPEGMNTIASEVGNRHAFGTPDTIEIEGMKYPDTNAPLWNRAMDILGPKSKYISNFIKDMGTRAQKPFRIGGQEVAVAKMARQELEKVYLKGNITDTLIKDKMAEIVNNPAMSAQASKMVEDFIFNHRNLGPTEKLVANRLFLFYGWPKNLVKLAFWTLPGKYPITAEALAGVSRMGNDIWLQRVKEFGASQEDIDWMKFNHMDLLFPVRRNDKDQTIDFIGLPGINIFNTILRLSLDSIPSHFSPLARLANMSINHLEPMGGFQKEMSRPDYQKDSAGRWWHITPEGKVEPSSGPLPSLKQEVWDVLPWIKVWDLSHGAIMKDQDGNPVLDKSGKPIPAKHTKEQIERVLFGLSQSHFDVSPQGEEQRAKFPKQFARSFYKKENQLNQYYQMQGKEE